MVPRKVNASGCRKAGTTWEVAAPAKLNLYLEVLGKRTDGFHELETLLVPVQIYDELRWSAESPVQRGGGCSLSIDQQFSPAISPTRLDDQDNLVLRAARLLAERAGVEAHGHFHLTKRIPLQAGMGGGSSDAAATLLLVNECWKAHLTNSELNELAVDLGSDVPYFLNIGPAVCRGRGELIEPLGGVPLMHFVLVKPAFGLSTPRVFAELGECEMPTATRCKESARRLGKLIAALNRGAVGAACDWMSNRLEAAAARLAPEIPLIKTKLAQSGCWGQFMTGSGSTLVGIARSATQARRIARSLSSQRLGTVLATASGW